MDVRQISRNPREAIIEAWGTVEGCEQAELIFQLSASLQTLKSEQKEMQERKGQLSGQFRSTRDDHARLGELKSEMANVSRKLKELKEARREHEQELMDCFSSALEDQRPEFPPRFSSPETRQDISVSTEVFLADDKDAAAWNDYVRAHPRATPYHLYEWKQVVQDCFGHPCYYFAARDRAGTIIGLLPLVAIESRLFGHYAISLPYFNYGGPLADSPQVREALLECAAAEASRQDWEHVEYRTVAPNWGLPATQRKVSMILRLPADESRLEDELKAKVRAQYRQAEDREPQVCFGGSEVLDDFYRVFSRNMRDLGTPVYPKSFFRAIADRLAQHTTLVRVTIDGKAVAAAFLIGYGDMLEIPWASTLKEYNSSNVNMWMYRQILGFAVGQGYDYFDFGRSTVDAGTYHFKKQWGARALQHHWYYQLEGDEELPALNPDNPKFRAAIATWKRLPLFVANSLGPRIVKNLP